MWIESHQSLRNHRKTGRLARRLGVNRVAAIGHLHCFWWWCMDNAPNGTLAGIDAEDIAEGAEWEGDPAEFVAALDYAGFTEDGTIHDWYDYAGKLIERRQKDAARKRESRHPADDPPTKSLRNGDIQRTSSGHPADGVRTVPNRTQPNQTQPDQESPLGVASAPRQAPQTRPVRTVPKPKDTPAPKNPWWDALVAGIGVTPTTDQERQLYGKTVRELRALDATPETILDRCANYRARFPNAELTCTALTKHWSRVEHPPPEPVPIPSRNGRRPTVEERNLELFHRMTAEEPDDEPHHVPEAIDVAWHSDEQGTQPRTLRPVVEQVRRAPR